jgi:hypothetical protein
MRNLFAQCKKLPSAADLQAAKEKKINEVPWHMKHQHVKEIRRVKLEEHQAKQGTKTAE